MRRTPTILFILTALVAAALLAGCGSSGVGDVLGGGSRSNYSDVKGTVTSVDTRDRTIVVDQEGTGSYLRDGGSDEVVLHYDDSTRVDYQGKSYRAEDLERGDRITANVDESSSRLYARDIQVLYDVSGGTGDYGGTVDDRGTLGSSDLRGVVRYVDTRSQTLEIEPSRYDSRFSTGRSGDVVVVHYDSQTTVEYQGRNYEPENLEKGDEVEIDIRDSGGRLLAEQIVVVGENQPTR
ncbi:MAG TPA: hypothetical protein VGX68_11870 [Thermoanaerobaculia bacterium]|jgi:hypothetical protein|nr:hypothetical protein [Thermoanaerobaculia bacterium]